MNDTAANPNALKGRISGPKTGLGFSPLLMIGLVITGLFAFSALVLLSSYSDELRPDEPAIASAQDTSAVGYLALYKLLGEAGIETKIDPFPHRGEWDGRSIRLYFPNPAFTKKRFERVDANVPGLIVLPKWQVSPKEEGSNDVVRRADPGLTSASRNILSIIHREQDVFNGRDITVDLKLAGNRFQKIKHIQFIAPKPEENLVEIESQDDAGDEKTDEAGDATERSSLEDELEKVITTVRRRSVNELRPYYPDRLSKHPAGDILFGEEGDRLLILAEPDLFNNQGISTEQRARAALSILSDLSRRFDIDDPIIVFDDSLRRRDTQQNLVKLLTRPPFLAATLCLLAAGLMVGWQGANRFGDPAAGGVTTLRGSATLARTAAQFIRGAGRLDAIAPGYADVSRRQVIEQLGLDNWGERRIDAFISKRETQLEISPSFAEINANTDLDPMGRAGALQRWKEEILS